MNYNTSLANSRCSMYTEVFQSCQSQVLILKMKKESKIHEEKTKTFKCKATGPNQLFEPPDYLI